MILLKRTFKVLGCLVFHDGFDPISATMERQSWPRVPGVGYSEPRAPNNKG